MQRALSTPDWKSENLNCSIFEAPPVQVILEVFRMRSFAWTLVFVAMSAGSVWAQSGTDADSVLAVQGRAEVRVVPDLAVVRMGVGGTGANRPGSPGVSEQRRGIASSRKYSLWVLTKAMSRPLD